MGNQNGDRPDDLTIKCMVRRSIYAVNPEFDEDQEMECALRNWGGDQENESTGFPLWGNDDASIASNSVLPTEKHLRHSKDEPELYLNPIHLPAVGNNSRNSSFSVLPMAMSGTPSANNSVRAAEIANGVSQRFHSFGSAAFTREDSDVSVASSDFRKKSMNNSMNSLPPKPSTVPVCRNDSDISGFSYDKRRKSSLDQSVSSIPLRSIAVNRIDSDMSTYSSSEKLLGGKGLDASMASLPPRIEKYRAVDGNKPVSFSSTSRRSRSAAKSSNSLPDFAPLRTWSIPVSDIANVDLSGTHTYRRASDPEIGPVEVLNQGNRSDGGSSRITITTLSNGYFEFSFHSNNSRDVLVAFLKSSISVDRFTSLCPVKNNKVFKTKLDTIKSVRSIDTKSSFSSSKKGISTFDIDNFTEKAMNDWVKTESITEKMKRRVDVFSTRLGEITLTLTDCVCFSPSTACTPNLSPHPDKRRPSAKNGIKQYNRSEERNHMPMIMSYEGDRQFCSKLSEGEMKVQSVCSYTSGASHHSHSQDRLNFDEEKKEHSSVGSFI